MSTSDDELQQRLAQMWSPGWKERFLKTLSVMGYLGVCEFLADHPSKPYDEIVMLFWKEFAPIQIISCQFDEARQQGTVLNALRDSLSRHIVAKFPDGWGIGENVDYRRASALSGWGTDAEITGQITFFDQVFDCFIERFSPSIGWIPSGSDDPIISAALDECWRKHATY